MTITITQLSTTVLASMIALSLFATSPAHADETATWGGDEEGTKVEAEFQITQDEYEYAQGVNFTSYNKDRDINGWYMRITEFSDAGSEQAAAREVDAEAYGQSVARNTEVDLYIEQWLEGDWNEQGLKDVVWTDESRGEVKVMPDHYWHIGFPQPLPDDPGLFRHRFTIENDDSQFNLRVTDLTFLVSMDELGDDEYLHDQEFVDPPYQDLELLPGQGWTVNLVTDGDWIDGYIYFKYDLYDCLGDRLICHAYGAHPILAEPCVGDVNEDGFVDIDDIFAVLSAWGPCM